MNYRFAFIHVCKNGGSSIRRSLAPYCYLSKFARASQSIFKKMKFEIPAVFGYDPCPLHYHATAIEAIEFLGYDLWQELASFAVVRNPWDWQLSLYSYILGNKKHPQYRLVKGLGSFDAYIEWRCHSDLHSQHYFILNHDGSLAVKRILKYESLSSEYAQFMGGLLAVPPSLPWINRSVHDDYRNVYTSFSRNLVGKYFHKDIELFGYDFGF